MTNYIDEAIWIFELIRDRYTDNDGMLIYRFDSITGKVVDNKILVSDFGDYIQNFFYLGIISDREDICSWSLKHIINASKIYQNKNGFFLTNKKKLFTSIADNADTLEGLSTLLHISKDTQILKIIKKFVKGIEKKCDHNGYLPAKYFGPFNWPISHADYSGNFVEELVLLYEETGEEKYRDLAKRLTHPWINSDYFNNIGLIQRCIVSPSLFHSLLRFILEITGRNYLSSNLVKSNTNLISGILRLWETENVPSEKKKYKEKINQWKDGVETHCAMNGYYFGRYDALRKQTHEYKRPMPDNHHILAAYADIYFFCKDSEYLSLLKKGCNFWIDHQKESGLFPESPIQSGENSKRAILDSNLDLSIVLFKAYSLTGQKKYLYSGKNCIDAIIKYFKRDFGYNEIVEAETGEMMEHGRLFTKYITLFIKGLLILDQILKGEDIYSKDLFLISRDR